MDPLLLCVDMDPAKQMRLSFLASPLGIRMRVVDKAQQGMTLGMLCGLDAPRAGKGVPPVPGEMLVMAFLSEDQTDRLLRNMRKDSCAVSLKAVLTPYNRHWTCGQLYRTLEQEAKKMRAGSESP